MTDEKRRYERVMESLRAKLKNPGSSNWNQGYTGNRAEGYRDGIRAAMSLIKDVYGSKSNQERAR